MILSAKYSDLDYVYHEMVNTYFDTSNREMRQAVLCLEDDSSKATVAANLAAKLYAHIVNKTDDIDYGIIPSTKGDFTKVTNYKELCECIGILTSLQAAYSHNKSVEETNPISVVERARVNIVRPDVMDMFKKCYMMNIDLGKTVYENVSLAIFAGVSLNIATYIDFIKDPENGDLKLSYETSRSHNSKYGLLIDQLQAFNNMVADGSLEKALGLFIKARVKNFAMLSTSLLISGVGTVTFAFIVASLVFSIIPMTRELIYYFYNSRVKLAAYFEMQSQLLTMHAEDLDNNSIEGKTPKEIADIKKKQLRIAALFHKMSNAMEVESAKAQTKATVEIQQDNDSNDEIGGFDDLNPNGSDSIF